MALDPDQSPLAEQLEALDELQVSVTLELTETEFEFDESYKMIADNTPQILLGQSGQSKHDFADIICDSREFYEGVIQWTYLTLMARVPTSEEVDKLMNTFYYDYDLQYIQRQIMISDEYAHFK